MSDIVRLQTAAGSGKGRQFTAVVPVLATSSSLWEVGSKTEALRPIFAVVVASSQEFKPVLANLREHGRCVVAGSGLSRSHDWRTAEFVRRAGYQWSPPQPIPEEDAVAVHVYEPNVFGFTPAVPEAERVAFAVMPAHVDLDEVLRLNQADLRDAHHHAFQLGYPERDLQELGITPRFIALSAIWAKTLQRRTIWAVPQKLAFRVQLLLACLKRGVVTTGDREATTYASLRRWWNAGAVDFTSIVHPKVGIHPGLATSVKAKVLENVLVEEVSRFDYMRRKKSAAVAGAAAVTTGKVA